MWGDVYGAARRLLTVTSKVRLWRVTLESALLAIQIVWILLERLYQDHTHVFSVKGDVKFVVICQHWDAEMIIKQLFTAALMAVQQRQWSCRLRPLLLTTGARKSIGHAENRRRFIYCTQRQKSVPSTVYYSIIIVASCTMRGGTCTFQCCKNPWKALCGTMHALQSSTYPFNSSKYTAVNRPIYALQNHGQVTRVGHAKTQICDIQVGADRRDLHLRCKRTQSTALCWLVKTFNKYGGWGSTYGGYSTGHLMSRMLKEVANSTVAGGGNPERVPVCWGEGGATTQHVNYFLNWDKVFSTVHYFRDSDSGFFIL